MTDDTNAAMDIAYLALGRLIAGQCPAGFAKATMTMELDESGRSLLRIVHEPQGGGAGEQAPLNEGAARDILESLRHIRNLMEAEDGRAWRSCTVTLVAGGHFAMDVAY